MLISAMPPGTGPIGVPSEPFAQYGVSNQLFGMGQGLGTILHSQPGYGFPRPTRPAAGFAQARQDIPLDPSATGRSPLLEQFRADKSKTWQLRVSIHPFGFARQRLTSYDVTGYSGTCHRILWRPTRLAVHSAEA